MLIKLLTDSPKPPNEIIITIKVELIPRNVNSLRWFKDTRWMHGVIWLMADEKHVIWFISHLNMIDDVAREFSSEKKGLKGPWRDALHNI